MPKEARADMITGRFRGCWKLANARKDQSVNVEVDGRWLTHCRVMKLWGMMGQLVVIRMGCLGG